MWYDGPEPWIDYYAGEPTGGLAPQQAQIYETYGGPAVFGAQRPPEEQFFMSQLQPGGWPAPEIIEPERGPFSLPPGTPPGGPAFTAGLTPTQLARMAPGPDRSIVSFFGPQPSGALGPPVPTQQAGMAGASQAQVQAAQQYATQGQVQQQADSAAIAQRATPGTTSSDDAWWKEFTAVHGETPQQFYSRRENWKPGSTSWQDNVAFDTKLQANFREATGKSEMTDVDWKRAYGWWRSGYSLTPMDPRLLGHRPGGGGGGAPSPNATPASQQVTPYEIPAAPYVGVQNRLTIPNLALGELSRQGRDAFGNILTGAGWVPTGVMGAYGPTEYRRETPAEVWFPREAFPASRYGQEAAWGFGEAGWAPRIARP